MRVQETTWYAPGEIEPVPHQFYDVFATYYAMYGKQDDEDDDFIRYAHAQYVPEHKGRGEGFLWGDNCQVFIKMDAVTEYAEIEWPKK